MTTTRRASCSCGKLEVTCEGEPVRVSICHCLACQKRTGSAFGAQARFERAQVTRIEGPETSYVRTADSGQTATFHFCPSCGATVYYELAAVPGFIAVAVGAFADPQFPAPRVSVYEARRHPWAAMPSLDVEHHD
jgi:hypothetical protein